ncbi:MAG TPA: helix-turn-helix domain-containing protein [Bradyrhizobium sp.]|nr:helix-turn-helix domain-containing protein [Bradyrhizobium sp.]
MPRIEEEITTVDKLRGSQLRDSLARAYPYVLFDIPPGSDGQIAVRKIGPHLISHLRTASWNAEATVGHADAQGFGETIKLVWQLKGAMTYEDKARALQIRAGEIFVTRSSSDYFLDMSDDFEGLVLTFDASVHVPWLDRVGRDDELVVKPSGAGAASAAGVMALLHQPGTDGTSELALHSLFELATGAVQRRIADPPSERLAPSLVRAGWLIRQHIADRSYTPERLACDLGLSRRSLYNRFADAGLTPAGFMRAIRLEQARQEIEADLGGRRSLTTIALRCGFADSASLSHAIKAAYGVAPSALRKTMIDLHAKAF